MKTDKITIVTGEPRSGTSLMMQTLSLLQVPVAGTPNIDRKGRKRGDNLNPRGFFEIPGVVVRGVTDSQASDYYGKVLKVVNSGIVNTDISHIGTVFLCLRNPKNIATSQKGLHSNVLVKGKTGEWQYAQAYQKTSPQRYIRKMGKLLKWFSPKGKGSSVDLYIINYAEFLSNPEISITNIITKLGLTVASVNKQAAIDNVGIGKPGSKKTSNSSWDTSDGILAKNIYRSLQNLPSAPDQEVMASIDEWESKMYLDNTVSWVNEDFGLFLIVNSSLYQSLKVTPALRNNLLSKSENRVPYDCRRCIFHNRSGSFYTIKTGSGDITRKKVICTRDDKEVTLEKCYSCWQQEKSNQGV